MYSLPALQKSLTHLGITLHVYSKDADQNNPKVMPEPQPGLGIAFILSRGAHYMKVSKHEGNLQIGVSVNNQLGAVEDVDGTFRQIALMRMLTRRL
jgi:hypothetical protein